MREMHGNRMSRPPRLFVFEGPDGIGKTTLSQRFAEELTLTGEECVWTSFPGREPGTLGRLVYNLHHDPSKHSVERIDPTSVQMLHIAAHFDAIGRVILPTIKSGRSVVMDRFWWSTWVYGVINGADQESLVIDKDYEYRDTLLEQILRAKLQY